jgi:hypothetical protein
VLCNKTACLSILSGDGKFWFLINLNVQTFVELSVQIGVPLPRLKTRSDDSVVVALFHKYWNYPSPDNCPDGVIETTYKLKNLLKTQYSRNAFNIN